jgi:hypothetical protein
MRMRNFLVVLIGCLTLLVYPASAALIFSGLNNPGQGLMTFSPGIGNSLVVGSGNGGKGALITNLFNSNGLCNGNCGIDGGYLTLTTGGETSGFACCGGWHYWYDGGGSVEIWGAIPDLGINTVSELFSAQFLPLGQFDGIDGLGGLLASIDPKSVHLNAALGKYQIVSPWMEQVFLPVHGCGDGSDCSGPAQITNVQMQTEVVPEPTSLVLLGSGVIALGSKLRRRR